jgi:phage shock protein A
MSNLFKKLSDLIKANVNDVLGERASDDPRRSGFRGGRDLNQQVASLREQVNDAIAHEDTLQRRINMLEEEAVRLDRQADAAVKAGNEAHARSTIAELQKVQKQRDFTAADLREHQLATADLLQRVNALDAMIMDARAAASTTETKSGPPAADPEALNRAIERTTTALDNANERIASLNDRIRAGQSLTGEGDSASSAAADAAQAANIEDDLAARRARLSQR